MTYPLPQRRQPLFLGVCVDVGSDAESNDVEEGYPCLLRQEFLSKGQGDRRRNPGNLHDGHEASADGGTNLVPGASTSDDGHGGQVN